MADGTYVYQLVMRIMSGFAIVGKTIIISRKIELMHTKDNLL